MIDLFKTQKKSEGAGKVILGTAAGVVAGFTAGILTAPRPGKETRDLLSTKASEAIDKAAETVEKQKTKAKESIDDAKTKTRTAVSSTDKAS